MYPASICAQERTPSDSVALGHPFNHCVMILVRILPRAEKQAREMLRSAHSLLQFMATGSGQRLFGAAAEAAG